MRNEHKTAFQKDKIQKLIRENTGLKEELRAMDIRNSELSKEVESLHSVIESMQAEHDTAMDEYKDAITQALEAKAEYEQMTAELMLLRHEYETKITALIQDIRDRK